MILAGLTLLAVGGADLVRAFARRRWVGFAAVGTALLCVGILSSAILEAIVAVLVGAAWVWAVPSDRSARAGLWPVVGIGVLSALAVMSIPTRSETGVIGGAWRFPTPAGDLSFDTAVLVVGTVMFLLESANVVVRVSLNAEYGPAPGAAAGALAPRPARPSADADDDGLDRELIAGPEPSGPQPLERAPALKGGRLIGPLERILIFALTLLSAYTLVAALIAAKGIVRFPEISRDSDRGNSAEYFLVGSMVSWVQALAAAALVWWALATV